MKQYKVLFILFTALYSLFPALLYPQVDTAWIRRYNGPGNNLDVATAIAIDNSGNVYVTGYSNGSGTGHDYATIKYKSNGNNAWIARYNGPGNDYDDAWSIAVDDSGNVYVTGGSEDLITSDDYATIKYVQTQGIEEENCSPLTDDRFLLEVFPNPAQGVIFIRVPPTFFLPHSWGEDRRRGIKIFDVSGKLIKEIATASPRNDNTIQISLDGIKNGVYFVKVDNNNQVAKIIVTR